MKKYKDKEFRRNTLDNTRVLATGSFRKETQGLDFKTTQKIETAYFNTLNPYGKGT